MMVLMVVTMMVVMTMEMMEVMVIMMMMLVMMRTVVMVMIMTPSKGSFEGHVLLSWVPVVLVRPLRTYFMYHPHLSPVLC